MTSEDQKMLESALWHISNSVTNGKSQTAECEITQWLKNKINSLPAERLNEELEEAANLYAIKQGLELKPFARRFFIAGANWQKERTIDKTCEWLHRCVGVDDEVKMIDGEPEVKSFIQKNLHRIEVTNQIIEDFKKAMEGQQY